MLALALNDVEMLCVLSKSQQPCYDFFLHIAVHRFIEAAFEPLEKDAPSLGKILSRR